MALPYLTKQTDSPTEQIKWHLNRCKQSIEQLCLDFEKQTGALLIVDLDYRMSEYEDGSLTAYPNVTVSAKVNL